MHGPFFNESLLLFNEDAHFHVSVCPFALVGPEWGVEVGQKVEVRLEMPYVGPMLRTCRSRAGQVAAP